MNIQWPWRRRRSIEITDADVQKIYGSSPSSAKGFLAWAARSNASYCRKYGTKVSGFNAEQWDQYANRIDPPIDEPGNEIGN